MSALSRLSVALVAFLVGGATLALAVPRTVGEFSLLSVEPLRQAVRDGSLETGDLMHLHGTQAAVLDAVPSGELALRKSATESALARSFPNDNDERALWYDMAEASVERSLLIAPGDPYAWSRLAYLRLRSGEEAFPAAKGPLMMSMLTGPRENPILFPRIRYAIRLWDQLSEDDIAVVEDQILWADRIDRNRLIGLARRDRRSMMIVFAAVARDLTRFRPFIERFNR